MLNTRPDLTQVSLLIVESDSASASLFKKGLTEFGAKAYVADSAENIAEILAQNKIHAIIAAIELADDTLITLVQKYKAANNDAMFFIITDARYSSVEATTDTVKDIVDDYIQRPPDIFRFALMLQTNLGRPDTGNKSLAIIEPLVKQVKPYFLFRSGAMRRALANISEIASSDQTVLISGETGTGKEIVARAVHVLSPRSQGPFVPINCGAIPESLIEGELFGHEKGAFTGAFRTRKGKFESADNGTLFLDEIGDMPLSLQVRLLRVLEEKKVYRVGSERPVPVNVRVIAATRVEIKKAVSDGLFREDLYYRLNILPLHLPPLRERVEDISILAVHFLERALVELGRTAPYPVLSGETINLLEHYPWKGNVRELRNIMTRAATLLPSTTARIFPMHIIPHLEEPFTEDTSRKQCLKQDGILISFGTQLDQVEDILIKATLKLAGGNRTKTAKMLGISLRTLRRKLNSNINK